MNRQNYKRLIIMSLFLLIFAFTISGCSSTDKESVTEKVNDEGVTEEVALVARVNKEGITEEEFESEFQLFKMAYERQYGEDFMGKIADNGETNEENLKKDIMERLIIQKIIFKEIKDKKIVVTDEELKARMDLEIERIGGEEKFEEYLEEEEDLTREILEENIRKELLLNKHVETFNNETIIPDDEAKEYFETNKDEVVKINVSHILIETEEEGKEILKRLDEGEDFGAIALIESIDSVSAMEGGNLGYFPKRSLITEFEDVAFDLKTGETSGLVKTELGYHIIHIEDRKDTYEALEKDVKALLLAEKYKEKLEELRATAKVKVYGKPDKK